MKRQPDRKQVGIWIRVSTEDQVKGESPEHHERRARLYAEAKDWKVVQVYRLDAISGKTVKDLPETKRMIEDVRAGRIQGLIFSKLARLARNTKELLEFADIFRECGADLVSLAESIDTSTPAGRLFYTMIAAMAQWEREEIAQRVAASVPIRAQLGKSLGGKAPFGYRWEDKKLVRDTAEAQVRKLMYELFLKHRAKKTVARLLNERGYRTRNGSRFSDTTVDRLLRDPIAKGTRRANYTRTLDNRGAWALKPEKEWVLQAMEPIISESLWNDCNAVLAAQAGKNKRLAQPAVHLFAGITYCTCGAKMYVLSKTTKYTCQKCRNKIPSDDLEAVFVEQIRHLSISPDEIRSYFEQTSAAIQTNTALLEVLETERFKLQKEIDRLHELYQAEMIDKYGFGEKYYPWAERLRQLEDEIPTAQAELDVMKINDVSREEIVSGARSLCERWPDLEHAEKRQIILAVAEKIIVAKDEVEIKLYDLPAGSDPGNPQAPRGTGGGSTSPDTVLNRRKAAMNACPCGYLGHFTGRCRCTPDQIARYRSRISGPLLDRIDLQLEVPAVAPEELARVAPGEPSANIRERVSRARAVQLARQDRPNARLTAREVERYCATDAAGGALLRQAMQRLGLSARAYHRILKIARTIADLAGDGTLKTIHIAEATQYRRLDRSAAP